MIKTSDEGTSYCTQCEAWAKENEHLKEMERLRAMEITRLNCDVTRLDHETFELRARIAKLEAVVRAAEAIVGKYGWKLSHVVREELELKEALAALREGEP